MKSLDVEISIRYDHRQRLIRSLKKARRVLFIVRNMLSLITVRTIVLDDDIYRLRLVLKRRGDMLFRSRLAIHIHTS